MSQGNIEKKDPITAEVKDFSIYRSITGGPVCLRKYQGHEKHVIIPNVPGVGGILTGTFTGNTDIEVVDFTQITCERYEVQKGAFRNCVNLKTILFPQTGAQIWFDPQAFLGCTSLADENDLVIIGDTLYGSIRNKDDVRSVVIPQGIKKIAPRAFQHCNLWELTIPDSVEEIGNCAFLRTHLTVVELPNGLKKLGPGCFCGTDLKKIRIPGSVEVAQGFSSCDALREIIIENGVNRIDDLDWNSALKKIELPESIREISKGAFTKCEKLKTIVIKASQCTLDPEMLFYDYEKEEAKKSKIQILCTEEVAEAAPENLKRFCVSNTKEKSGPRAASGTGMGHLYGSLAQFDVGRMIQDVAPGYTFDDPIFPKSETRKVPYGDTTISVKLRLQKLSKVQQELSGGSYAFYTALENMLTKDDVVALIEEVDPNYTSDAAYYARPMVDREAPTAAWSDVKNGFLFLSYIAFRLTDTDVLREVLAAMPRKKNGTFYKGRLLRIACPGFVTSESIPQIYAKADGDDAITISADCKSISEEELEKFEKDFVSTHQELFQLSKYSLT